MPTPKQINYAILLLRERGYNTEYMNAAFKELGARMSERRGSVRSWLEQHHDISGLIDRLKGSA